jgi:hypothetical protein
LQQDLLGGQPCWPHPIVSTKNRKHNEKRTLQE